MAYALTLALAAASLFQPERSGSERVAAELEGDVVGEGTWEALASVDADGYAVVEGDIRVGVASDERGAVVAGRASLWPNAVVPYVLDEKLKRPDEVRAAMRKWEATTPLRFVERTDETDYLYIHPGHGCWSYLGRQGGKQLLSLGKGCGAHAAVHELGHAIGLWHEQSRNDRDEHVTVHWDNICPDNAHNFATTGRFGREVGPYDIASVMHYDSGAFSCNGRATMTTRDGRLIRWGAPEPSPGDAAAARALYGEGDELASDEAPAWSTLVTAEDFTIGVQYGASRGGFQDFRLTLEAPRGIAEQVRDVRYHVHPTFGPGEFHLSSAAFTAFRTPWYSTWASGWRMRGATITLKDGTSLELPGVVIDPQ